MSQPNVKTSEQLEADLVLIRDAARESGRIAMSWFRKNPETWLKDGASPVSVADIAIDTFLRETLLAARPDYDWLSEETADDRKDLSVRRTFVVDPIDGTRAFIAGLPTWCVSIAVVEAGIPLAGVLECPALGERFEARAKGNAFRNGEVVAIVGASQERPRIAGPKAMFKNAPPYMRAGTHVPHIPSLAYRIAMIAKGEIDATFIKPDSHDWDLAAADLILRRAGGGILNMSGDMPTYAGPDPRHGALVAASGQLLYDMAKVIASDVV